MELTQEYKDRLRIAKNENYSFIDRAYESLFNLRLRSRKQPELYSICSYIDEDLLTLAFFKTNKKLSRRYVFNVFKSQVGYFEQKVNLLKGGMYRPTTLKEKLIITKGNETRVTADSKNFNKVIQKAIHLMLEAIYAFEFVNNSHAYQKKKGVHSCRNSFKSYLSQTGYNIVLKTDIRAFFDSINHELLLELLSVKIKDRKFIMLMKTILKTKVINLDNELKRNKSGVIAGSVIGPILSNIFLHFLFDKWALRQLSKITHHIFYSRYADDILFCFENYQQAIEFKALVKSRLAKIHLDLHPDKSKVIDISTQRLKYLGKYFSINSEKEVIMT